MKRLLAAAIMLFSPAFAMAESPIADTPFWQEYREFYAVPDNPGANDVRAIAVDGGGNVWTAAKGGIFRLDDGAWSAAMDDAAAGPAFAAETAPDGSVWFGAWNGVYRGAPDGTFAKVAGCEDPTGAIGIVGEEIVAMGPEGLWRYGGGTWTHTVGTWATTPRDIAAAGDGTLWMATAHGLYRINEGRVTGHLRDPDDILTGALEAATLDASGRLWVGGYNGIDVYEDGVRVRSFTPEEGLPHPDVRSLAFDGDGRLWVGTAIGAARWDGESWALRHGLRWLPSDDVRDIAIDGGGTAWVATPAGVSAIKRKRMTLAEKAAHFEAIVQDRKMREPGLVEKSRLLAPGDVSTWRAEDDDNDGGYSALYMIAEAFRYRVTGDPTARANAQKVFDAIEFLQTVTGTDGFIARTVVPARWAGETNDNPHRFHDANRTYTPQEKADALVRDPRFKPVEERWLLSDDGEWYWKRDTSSDEIIAHYLGFLYYYDLIAETEREKQRVRDLAAQIMDHIIDGGFVLIDIDGTHTRWAVWSPDRLLEDANWQSERPGNAAEILSCLKVTHYLTGDAKYEAAYRKLAIDFGYADIARAPKPTAPSESTHIDSELRCMMFPGLLKCETDPELRAKYLEGLEQWHDVVGIDHSPYFDFTYAVWGAEAVDFERAAAYLRAHPLDLIHWTMDNTKREDIDLVRRPEIEPLQTSRLLPADERDIMRWDKNPWMAVSGNGGHTEAAGTAWLLPYWMGRYYGFIGAPEQAAE